MTVLFLIIQSKMLSLLELCQPLTQIRLLPSFRIWGLKPCHFTLPFLTPSLSPLWSFHTYAFGLQHVRELPQELCLQSDILGRHSIRFHRCLWNDYLTIQRIYLLSFEPWKTRMHSLPVVFWNVLLFHVYVICFRSFGNKCVLEYLAL